MNQAISFIDLATQRDRIRDRIEARFSRIMDQGSFIMGPDVMELEAQLSDFGGMAHTISCASGTDALLMPLMAWNIGPGDAVFVPSFTFAATAEVVGLAGAAPVFVEVLPDTFNLDPAHLRRTIEETLAKGDLTPRAIIAVDLFGQIADYPAIRAVADEFGLKLISDAAQGFGSTLDGRMAGAWADVVATSFYPAKPLGCYGDGGAIQTDDVGLADVLRSIRVHGSGSDKYDNVRLGLTGRLDTFQAAVLIEKLALFPEEIEARMRIAARYSEMLDGIVAPQTIAPNIVSTWAQYTVRVPGGRRDAFMSSLKEAGVPSVIYYGKPLHRQTAYRHWPVGGNGLPVTDQLCTEVVSLPMHAYLDEATQDRIVEAARAALV
ncbi:DegT/DnrJ/EryC1/StrS family aminotransferase [Aureimonas phyllosphaerae]|uniref:dTDP-4-amino-4,6-dideoxygalactose transaminase n=1 Tax=Aureimonas phyllosphaerae TaxID=1166078 RepID=A0A7W6BRL3_9HYPH|nr:DegT/DnrJ/EryC1/StrS aminotransferase family protein [Aureimonas phyllosphaerae]MBB3934704.1 dTDP-4-amino-4,6-dideoxygalactose transaminase [Aureimonas phyllosphaerae]MBB3958081.1 dTDP-4-amino-4,6-dideoxygalactose transaminase [Aureimonas phyllosphaerae]SFE91496.1 dTDP-4-amino-4,6-dideoxygalactose transaminase [Aureimonas phyllosphaerae]